jgi:hypothetical protein
MIRIERYSKCDSEVGKPVLFFLHVQVHLIIVVMSSRIYLNSQFKKVTVVIVSDNLYVLVWSVHLSVKNPKTLCFLGITP